MTRATAAAPTIAEPTPAPAIAAFGVQALESIRPPIAIAACRRSSRPQQSRRQVTPVEKRIRDFLDGTTNGEELLHELFDHVLDEPIPEAMRALLDR